MFWVILGCAIVVSNAAKLNNQYLPPPPGAKAAGGSDQDLQLPLEPPYVDQYSNQQPTYHHDDTDEDYLPNGQQQGRSYDPSRAHGGDIGPKYTGNNNRYEPDNRQNYRGTHKHGTESRLNRINNVQHGSKDHLNKPSLVNEHLIKNIQRDEIENGTFISGSYSYKGPDNVLVTVTYSADKEDTEGEDRQARTTQSNVRESHRNTPSEELAGGIVPTPSSLPKELARAFDFHTNKLQGSKAEGKPNGYNYDKPKGESKPTVHGGYSYPRSSPAFNN